MGAAFNHRVTNKKAQYCEKRGTSQAAGRTLVCRGTGGTRRQRVPVCTHGWLKLSAPGASPPECRDGDLRTAGNFPWAGEFANTGSAKTAIG